MDGKIKHLELVQGVINRMANNSFMLKGWAVTLVAGVFCFGSQRYKQIIFFSSIYTNCDLLGIRFILFVTGKVI